MNLTANMKAARVKTGWSQQQMAHYLCVSRSVVRRIEAGKVPEPDVIEKWAHACGVTVEDLHGPPYSRPFLGARWGDLSSEARAMCGVGTVLGASEEHPDIYAPTRTREPSGRWRGDDEYSVREDSLTKDRTITTLILTPATLIAEQPAPLPATGADRYDVTDKQVERAVAAGWADQGGPMIEWLVTRAEGYKLWADAAGKVANEHAAMADRMMRAEKERDEARAHIGRLERYATGEAQRGTNAALEALAKQADDAEKERDEWKANASEAWRRVGEAEKERGEARAKVDAAHKETGDLREAITKAIWMPWKEIPQPLGGAAYVCPDDKDIVAACEAVRKGCNEAHSMLARVADTLSRWNAPERTVTDLADAVVRYVGELEAEGARYATLCQEAHDALNAAGVPPVGTPADRIGRLVDAHATKATPPADPGFRSLASLAIMDTVREANERGWKLPVAFMDLLDAAVGVERG